jgi:hypothetical protein
MRSTPRPILATLVVITLRSREAHAQGSPAAGYGEGLGDIILRVGGAAEAGLLVGGAVTDGMVISDLMEGRAVRHRAAAAGVGVWATAAVLAIPLTMMIYGRRDFDGNVDGGWMASAVALDLVALGSLGLSIYGLTLPERRAGATTPALAVHPTVIPAARSLAPGLALSFSL